MLIPLGVQVDASNRDPVKLLVFAHTPPPHHGQSYMVKLMLDRLGGDARDRAKAGLPASEIECYHVNCRYSEDLEDIGSFRLGKAWLVVRYCIEAIWCRFRHGVTTFYYVPAPGKRAALYRRLDCHALVPAVFPAFHPSLARCRTWRLVAHRGDVV